LSLLCALFGTGETAQSGAFGPTLLASLRGRS